MVKKAPRRTAERILEVTLALFNQNPARIQLHLCLNRAILQFHQLMTPEIPFKLAPFRRTSKELNLLESAWFRLSISQGREKLSAE